jgi:hypothetical protein
MDRIASQIAKDLKKRQWVSYQYDVHHASPSCP